MKSFAIIEIGSNNTKTHIYENQEMIYEDNITIEFKKNYNINQKIAENDLKKLFTVIEKALEYTEEVHIYGCSIFRNINSEELNTINMKLKSKFNVEIKVVTQEDEAKYTALGCYSKIKYNGNICVFIGGGGSIELIFVNNGKVFDKKYYDFGVVDVTQKFSSLKDDIPKCTFNEVYNYINDLIGNINIEAEVLILAGGDHLYWYTNAGYKLLKNNLYESESQKYMITKEMSDDYDHDALMTSLNQIRERSNNPLWFDGSRAMKVITNLISNKINAKYVIPTKINMEDGLKEKLIN